MFKKIYAVMLCFAMVATMSSCSLTRADRGFNSPANNYPAKDAAQRLKTEPIPQKTPETSNSDSDAQDAVDSLIASMNTKEKIYQMFFVTPESITKVGTATAAGSSTKAALERYPVGGIIYFASNLQNRNQVTDMISNTQSYSKIPLFIGVDEEGGIVSRLGKNANMQFPRYGSMWDVGNRGNANEAYNIGNTLGLELKKLGFNVDFAPVADVIIDPNNTEIGNRSFGTDPNLVGSMVEQFVMGMENTGVSSVLKHFPGHGSTSFNSHSGYSESKRTMAEICNTELIPFKKGISAGADFVLVSHMTLVNAIYEKVPASISKEIITDMLKGQMGFGGIVITDAMNMGAIITKYSVEDACVRAVNAGVDMILMPYDIDRAYNAIYNAVQNGTISEDRIDESVRRILTVKMQKIW